MAEKSDAEIKSELISLGVSNIGPITDSTRPLYLKKLARLRAEKKTLSQSTKASPSRKSQRGNPEEPTRRTYGISSDESDGDSTNIVASHSRKSVGKAQLTTQSKRPLRSSKGSFDSTRTFVSPPSSKGELNVTFENVATAKGKSKQKSTVRTALDESLSRTTYRSPNTSLHDGPLMKSAYLQTSFNSTMDQTAGIDDSYLSQSRSVLHRNEFSDSDGDDTHDFTSLRSQSFNSNGFRSSQTRRRTTSQKSRHALSKPSYFRTRDSFLDPAGIMGTDGMKTADVKPYSKLSNYVSVVLLLMLALFFGFVFLVYTNIVLTETNRETGKNCPYLKLYLFFFALGLWLSLCLEFEPMRRAGV